MKHYSTPFIPKRGLPQLTPAQRDFVLNFDDEEEVPRLPGKRRKDVTIVKHYEDGVERYVPGTPLRGVVRVSDYRANLLRKDAASGASIAALVDKWDLRPEWIEEILTTKKRAYRFGELEDE